MTWRLLSSALVWIVLATVGRGQDQSIRLVHTYQKHFERLIGLSSDGQWLLTNAEQEVSHCEHPNMEGRCFVPVLTAYDTNTGAQVKRWNPTGGWPRTVSFEERRREVLAVQETLTSRFKLDRFLTKWDPQSETVSRSPLAAESESRPLCIVDDQKVLNISFRGGVEKLAVADSTRYRVLKQPGLPRMNGDFLRDVFEANCKVWRSGTSFLIQSAHESELHWVPTDPTVPSKLCASFPSERVHGYAISPDRELIAVITGRGKLPRNGFTLPPSYETFLNLLDGARCSSVRRIQIPYAEANIMLAPGFATHLAISPDKTRLAIAYGVKRDKRAVACFDVLALPDGRRLATLEGDSHTDGESLGHIHFSYSFGAPTGAMLFSPDSRTFYATSISIRQWDLSGLPDR